MVKAIGGGGGRGIRAAHTLAELEAAFARAASEARAQLRRRRACSSSALSRQRAISKCRSPATARGSSRSANAIAPCNAATRNGSNRARRVARLVGASDRRGGAAAGRGFINLGTFEFLRRLGRRFFFIEANPRLQVEHGVTEETAGLDLVRLQIALAGGAKLGDLGVAARPPPRGAAIEWRIVAEGGGRLQRFRAPAGPGLRVDTAVAEGEEVALAYDPLLAKLIVRGADFTDAARRSRRALAEWEIEGAAINLEKLLSLAADDFDRISLSTGSIAASRARRQLWRATGRNRAPLSGRLVEIADAGRIPAARRSPCSRR